MSEGTGVRQGSLGYPNALVSSDDIFRFCWFGLGFVVVLVFVCWMQIHESNGVTTMLSCYCNAVFVQGWYVRVVLDDTKDIFLKEPEHVRELW